MKKQTYTLFYTTFFIAILLNLFSCSQNNEKIVKTVKTADSLALPQQTILANLPDSSRPKQIFLDKNPAPQIIKILAKGDSSSYTIPTKKGLKIVKLRYPSIHSHINSSTRQPIAADAQGAGLFTNFTTDNGLALDGISTAIMDKMGNLWFGTFGGGVSRYDGKSFSNFTTEHGLANNTILTITEDKKGNIWFGTGGGVVSKYDGKTFTNFTTVEGIANNSVLSIAEDKSGNLWFGTYGGGVSRYDGKIFTPFTTEQGLADNTIYSIAEDKSGNIWFGTYGKGISRYDGKSFTTFTSAQGLISNYVFTITLDKSGNLWLGTNGGVSKYDGKSFTNFTTEQGLVGNNFRSITEDKMGNIWMGSEQSGVSRYDGKTFTNFTSAQGLPHNNVRSITEDKMGNIWFGTFGGGASRYGGKAFSSFTTAQGLAYNTVCITEDKKGNLWMGTDGGGVSRYDSKSFTNFNTAQGLANNTVYSVAEDKMGNLWFGTFGAGVSRYDGQSFTNFTTAQGLAGDAVASIKKDKKGNLWIGTDGCGVSCYDGKSFTNFTTAQGLAHNTVLNITEDKNGHLWFATFGAGVSRYDGQSFTNFTTAQGLADNTVGCITEDNMGNLWFATLGGGLSRYDGKSFINFTTAQGLPDNVVTQVVIDAQQNIVVGTNFGVAVLLGFSTKLNEPNSEHIIATQNALSNQELKNYTPNFEIYNSSTGYPIKDVNGGQNTMFADSKGILWIATGSAKTGLVRFDYNAIHRNTNAPEVFIQNVKINDEKIVWNNLSSTLNINKSKLDTNTIDANITEEVNAVGKTLSQADRDSMRKKYRNVEFDGISYFYPIPQNLILPYQHNSLTFDFNAIETGQNYLVRYQYILEGYDKGWSPVSEKNSATFGNMNEGNYTFKLKARSPSGVWSKPLEYKFEVLPPWWRTWWMYALYITALLLSIAGFVKWRERNLKRENIILEDKIEVRTKQLSEKNAEITEKNKEITDSINYALRIQQAILPAKQDIYAFLPNSFVLYKPKDIVSGDFYFFVKNEKSALIAAADCTGHGVPGAMMSMVGVECLKDAVRQSNNTSEILSLLNNGVKKSLQQSSSKQSTRDGMDIALCSIDLENRIVHYAGSNRPIWIIRGGQSEVEEIIATRKAIGGLTDNDQYFDTHKIQLNQGDTFYISTDGYADTFGGQDGKKLMTKKFKQMLIEIQAKTMQEQEVYLDNFIEEWKAGADQVDDILVIGVRV